VVIWATTCIKDRGLGSKTVLCLNLAPKSPDWKYFDLHFEINIIVSIITNHSILGCEIFATILVKLIRLIKGTAVWDGLFVRWNPYQWVIHNMIFLKVWIDHLSRNGRICLTKCIWHMLLNNLTAYSICYKIFLGRPTKRQFTDCPAQKRPETKHPVHETSGHETFGSVRPSLP
jgi:hypothetical protein